MSQEKPCSNCGETMLKAGEYCGCAPETSAPSLECFRRAAELGCEDFAISEQIYLRGTEACSCLELPYPVREGYDAGHAHRINRYAAAVCAEFWHSQYDLEKDATDQSRVRLIDSMIQSARAFGQKYGGA